MGFGLPSALGAAVAFDGRNGRPKRVVVDIDGDGSFLMNVQVSEGGDTCTFTLLKRPGPFAPETRPGPYAPDTRPGPYAPDTRPGPYAPDTRPGPYAPDTRPGP